MYPFFFGLLVDSSTTVDVCRVEFPEKYRKGGGLVLNRVCDSHATRLQKEKLDLLQQVPYCASGYYRNFRNRDSREFEMRKILWRELKERVNSFQSKEKLTP